MPRGSVVLLSAEDDLEDTIKPRLIAAGADAAKVHALTTLRLPNGKLERFSLAYLPHLERAILRFGDTTLVVIDPVTSYIGVGVDDHKAASLRQMIDPLKELAARRRVAIVLVTHLNKGNGTKALNRVTGSGAYTALARSNWLIVKDADEPRRRLFLCAGTNLVQEPSGLAYRIDPVGRVEWESQPVLMTADEALEAVSDGRRDEKGGSNPSKIEQAEAWLADLLGKGDEVPSTEILAQGLAKGFHRKTLFEAKARAGIRARKCAFAGGWSWYMAPQESPPAQGNTDGDGWDASHPSDAPF
jgi:hypothetical protein